MESASSQTDPSSNPELTPCCASLRELWHLSEPQFPHLPGGKLTGADLNPPESKRLNQRISTSGLPRVAGVLESSPGSEIFTGAGNPDGSPESQRLEKGNSTAQTLTPWWEPAASSHRGPHRKRYRGAGSPEQVRGPERGCPFSQSQHEIPVCPFPAKNPVDLCPRAKVTFLGVFRKPPSHRETNLLPPPSHRELKGEAGPAGEEGKGPGRGHGSSEPRGRGVAPPTRHGLPDICGQDRGRRQQQQ